MDQLRTFIAAAEEGSFSAAGRKLKRAQSVVSQTLANLERQIGIALFDRSGRAPKLTEAGVALLVEARAAASCMDSFKATARALSEGLEPELSVAIDVMYPIEALTKAVQAFHEAFPHTPLRLYVEALGAVLQPVLDGTCQIGVIGTLPDAPGDCHSEFLMRVPAVTVVAPGHPLTFSSQPVSHSSLGNYVQLVLTDRSRLSEGRNFGVLSAKTWRLADLGAKHAFLRAGLGWGHMPEPMVREDMQCGKLVKIELEAHPTVGAAFSMYAISRKDAPPGPAGRWFITQLKRCEA